MIYPGSTLGVLGGGQLGRMFTMAAHSMGYRVCVLDPDPDSPAGSIAEHHLQNSFTDVDALEEMRHLCSAVTTEFENVPASTLEFFEQSIPVRPSADALAIAKDRVLEKTFIRDLGLPTAEFFPVNSEEDCITACKKITLPALLKTNQLGYDGKGQAQIHHINDAISSFGENNNVACILEQRVELKKEISVILARNAAGDTVTYPVGENHHVNGILSTTTVPAQISEALSNQAVSMATRLANKMEYCGILTVEFFITVNDELLINEIAPRPHNSGHYTVDACVTDQFEQQVRMLCDLPPASTQLLSPVVMVNILGNIWPENDTPDWRTVYSNPSAKLHLYGKQEAREGRKMGHINLLTAEGSADAAALMVKLGIEK